MIINLAYVSDHQPVVNLPGKIRIPGKSGLLEVFWKEGSVELEGTSGVELVSCPGNFHPTRRKFPSDPCKPARRLRMIVADLAERLFQEAPRERAPRVFFCRGSPIDTSKNRAS